MDNIQARQESSTKKKLLVPIVVLILLAVGFTGAAYAYNSTLTVNNNAMDADYLSIDLETGSASTDVDVRGAKFITFTDNFTYAPDKTNQVKYTLNTPVTVAEVSVIVKGDINFNRLNVTSDIGSKKLCTVGGANKTVGDLFTLEYIVKATNSSGATVVDTTTLGEDGEMTATQAASDAGNVYYIQITATAKGAAASDYTDVNCGTSSDTAKAFRDAVNLLKFTIGVEATMA